MRKVQKEQERERRRLRDRQRRQSMSIEERERHLARRRRNYQLRRLRAENARLGLESQPQSQATTTTTASSDGILALNSASDVSVQDNDVGSNQEGRKCESEFRVQFNTFGIKALKFTSLFVVNFGLQVWRFQLFS